MERRTKKYIVVLAVFRSETNENRIAIGEGFTIIEATVRAIEYYDDHEEMQRLIHLYGPDDFAGLYEWYESRGIYISEPLILNPNDKKQ